MIGEGEIIENSPRPYSFLNTTQYEVYGMIFDNEGYFTKTLHKELGIKPTNFYRDLSTGRFVKPLNKEVKVIRR